MRKKKNHFLNEVIDNFKKTVMPLGLKLSWIKMAPGMLCPPFFAFSIHYCASSARMGMMTAIVDLSICIHTNEPFMNLPQY